jgi:ADP-heptose:LPS heptosyltransferase
LAPFEIKICPDFEEMATYTGFTKIPSLRMDLNSLIERTKKNIILHPKSNMNAREWSLENYLSLINLLPPDKFKIFICGSKKEEEVLKCWIDTLPPQIIDITGKLTLEEYISFISKVDYLVAASTGPLHIAAATGINAIGIYPPIKPINPTRWQPIGKNANCLCVNKNCSECRATPLQCHCINEISPQFVAQYIKE